MDKQCGRCKLFFPVEHFYWKNKAKGTRQSACRECCNERSADDYRKKAESYKTRSRRRNVERRLKAAQFKQSKKMKCADCGNRHPAVLEFHHLDPTTKEGYVGSMMVIEKILSEIEKCVVLCANCHRIRHWEERQAHVSPSATNRDKGNRKEDGGSTPPMRAN